MMITGLLVFLAPILIGVSGVLLPAAGYFPALGFSQFSTHPPYLFRYTRRWHGNLAGAENRANRKLFIFAMLFYHFDWVDALSWLCAVAARPAALVAVPHSAIAIGLVFLLAPSGWMMRILSPGITGFDSPPDWSLVPDPYGWALIFGLMAKEIPFLLMVSLAAMATLPARQFEQIANSLGYGRVAAWATLILPLIYRQIRLPVFAVLVFSLSVVDMALLLAPTLPPPLAILVLHGFLDADLAARLPASFGAFLQMALAVAGIGLWSVAEAVCRYSLQYWRRGGWRLRILDRCLPVFSTIAIIPLIAACAGLLAAFLWSIAGSWFFPSALPQNFQLIHWQDVGSYIPLLQTSLWLAGGAICRANSGSGMVICRAEHHPQQPLVAWQYFHALFHSADQLFTWYADQP